MPDHKAKILRPATDKRGARGLQRGCSEACCLSHPRWSLLFRSRAADGLSCSLSGGKRKLDSISPLAALAILKMQEVDGSGWGGRLSSSRSWEQLGCSAVQAQIQTGSPRTRGDFWFKRVSIRWWEAFPLRRAGPHPATCVRGAQSRARLSSRLVSGGGWPRAEPSLRTQALPAARAPQVLGHRRRAMPALSTIHVLQLLRELLAFVLLSYTVLLGALLLAGWTTYFLVLK
ncbi:hypothetical protein QTO34_012186 [Cnephaeus nilssonii]|uniref:Uncharacterized protein n=1 Tax=Cnephaeus nilssonii TaxID=3371016 RepID=A0AA40HCL3_CNENI|nr:hypothetical protein QTO34_012186 [Eptesicus nilssonii]